MTATPPFRVIFMNGPPRVGKDYLANHVSLKFGYTKLKMTTPMDTAMKALLGFCDEQYKEYREIRKDTPLEMFNGRSFREILIDFSEEFCKPNFGDSFFGKRAADTVLASPEDKFISTDSGFPGEACEIVNRVGAQNCLLVRVHADGCDFNGDSRGWLQDIGCQEIDFHNQKNDRSVKGLLDVLAAYAYT